jgi:hypothetical protein
MLHEFTACLGIYESAPSDAQKKDKHASRLLEV